ncbi:hypothetical protein JO41_00755 [Treponema sp. OMZ 838]|uniref:DUF2715 domain-containing protein n=1 Tax=Treponema sp. OMZ 838 TaxID=1539298 RepID=UPI000530126D|nr:DUF2715 domain-containing protein [Treponema sp. OMZ 838]AIW88503.1 hypothetical protein JO41_00755 [Treponema sp. OMZ 838]
MKHKKMVLVLSLASAVFAFADFSISFGPAFTNYFVHSKNEGDVATLGSANLENAVKNLTNESNNAAGIAVDLRAEFFYLMAQIAFPGKSHKDLFNNVSSETANFIKKSPVIFDSQIGAGYTFFKKSRFNLFVGGGLGLNAMSSTETAKIGPLNASYEKLDVMFGLGANILASFYFTDMIGIYGGIADTFYFVPLKVEKTFKLGSTSINVSNKDKLKDILANSVNLKLGLSLKF